MTVHQLRCSGCGRPLVLAFKARRSKVCETCYLCQKKTGRSDDRRRGNEDRGPVIVSVRDYGEALPPPAGKHARRLRPASGQGDPLVRRG